MADGTELVAPRAREAGLVVRELEDEVLVFDVERNEAHCLNRTAGLVWRYCNGETTVEEIRSILEGELGTLVSRDVVWHALLQLGKDHLLQEQVSLPAGPRGMTRRDMIVRAAGVAVTLPFITSIAMPANVQAASCATCGQNCLGTLFPPCCATGNQCTFCGTFLRAANFCCAPRNGPCTSSPFSSQGNCCDGCTCDPNSLACTGTC